MASLGDSRQAQDSPTSSASSLVLNGTLADPDRLATLHGLDLLDTLPEEAFDRYTRLATRCLGVPVSLISLVDVNRQFFKSQVGLEDPWATARQTPLTHSFCQHVVASGQPLVVADARDNPLLRNNLAIPEIGVVAYLGIPLITNDGHGLGSLCAIDGQPRQWSEDDVATLSDLAAAVMTEIDLRRATDAAERARDAVDQQRRFIRSVVETTAEGIIALDQHGRIVDLNPVAAGLLAAEPDHLVGQSLREHFALADEWADLLDPVTGQSPLPDGSTVRRADLTIAATSTVVEMTTTTNPGPPQSHTVLLRDLTDQRAAEASQRDAHLQTMIRHGADVIIVLARDLTVRYVSPSIQRVLGFTPTECLDAAVVHRILDDDRVGVVEALMSLDGDHDAVIRFDARVRDRSGQSRWLEVVATNRMMGDDRDGIVINARDVTDRKAFEQQLQHDATHDPLTSLPNRTLFLQRLEAARLQAGLSGMDVLVLFIDLDDFKVVNDSLGHVAGDQLLIEVGDRLRQQLGAGAMVSRFGGDEFLILIEHVGGLATAGRVTRLVLDILAAPFELVGHRTIVRASVGVVLCSLVAGDVTQVLSAADTALYRAKAAGGSTSVVYAPWMADDAQERLRMEIALRHAIATGELVVHYQPIVDLTTGALVGAEALLRWAHPEQGLIRPDAFLPLAETTGLIHTLGMWVLEEACRQISAWGYGAGFRVWVNVATSQLHRPCFAAEVADALAGAEVAPSQVRLEITEQVAIQDGETAMETLHALRAHGVGLAIDDFGTGYSSLAALQRYPVDTLKIDRGFVAKIAHDPDARAVIQAIVGVGQALGLRVTAEGIETEEQRDAIRALGCHDAQGYLFGRPSPAAEFGVRFAPVAAG